MLTKGIDTTIRDLIVQLPKGNNGANLDAADFEKLITPLAEKISSAIVAALSQQTSAPAASTTPAPTAAANPVATTAAPSSSDRLNSLQLSLLRDRTLPIYEQLTGNLTAGDAQYNQRESLLRERLDLTELEHKLQDKARALDVSYDRSDLEGILRNAGYDATHMGSSERYMSAVEKYLREAENNYRQRATNVPGQG